MAMDTTSSSRDDIPDAEIIEAEEVGRLEILKTRTKDWTKAKKEQAQAALAAQHVIVRRRVADWFGAADATDEVLAQEIEARRNREARQKTGLLEAEIAREKLAIRNNEFRPGAVPRLAELEARLEICREFEPEIKVVGKDLVRARRAKKAGRAGAVALGGLAYVNGIAAEPLLALASLGAVPAAWWWLARPFAADEHKPQAKAVAVFAQPGPDGTQVFVDAEGATYPASVVGADGMTIPDRMTVDETGVVHPVPAPAAGEVYVPQTLADVSRISMVKRDPAAVRGEGDLVTALVKAGIITEAQRDETHLAGVIKPDGPGWAAVIELPRGMEAANAISKVEKLASALRIKKSRIEMQADSSEEGHEGRVRLWVANDDNPYGTEKTTSALVAADRWDFWSDGVPLGPDARRSRQTLELVWSSLLIGGLQGFGKSFLARLVAAAAALDPYMTVHVATGKAGPDWAATKHIARNYVAGNTPEKIFEFLDLLNDLIEDMQKIGRRLEQLAEDDPEKCPEGKLTRELAKEWGIGLTLLIVDELQELLDAAAMIKVKTDDDPESKGQGRNGKEVLVETMARFVRVSRYTGGMGLFVTQRPDADSVPTKLRGVCAKRACFRVKGAPSSKMVLGDDAVMAGAAPHMLLDSQKGVFTLDAGAEEGHTTLKADVIELPDFKKICLRGRALRQVAGTLTGFAAEYGKEDLAAAATNELLADCLTVLDNAGLDRARTERLLELLVAYHPAAYGELTAPQLQTRLREAGAGTTRKLGAVDGMKNANGYTREQLATAQKGK
jgi:hypothetical protein